MKNIAKVLIVIILAFSVSSCSKDEAKQSENLHSTTKTVPSNKAWISYDDSHSPYLAFRFLDDLGVKRGDNVRVEYEFDGVNGKETGILSTTALDGENLRLNSSRTGRIFLNKLNKKGTTTVNIKAVNNDVTMELNAEALIITIKS